MRWYQRLHTLATHPPPNAHTKFLCRSPGTQLLASGVWRWGLWEVSRLGGWSPHYRISALKRRDKKVTISLHQERAQRGGERREQEGSPRQTRNPPAPRSWTWTCSHHNCEKSVSLFWPLSQRYFIIAAPTLTKTFYNALSGVPATATVEFVLIVALILVPKQYETLQ